MSAAETALHTARTVVVAGSIVALVIAAGFTLYRLAKGPTNLDRIIASDLMVGIAVAGFALQVLLTDGETSLPVMLAISLVGFIGAVSMARFVHDRRVTGPRDVRRSRRRGDTARPIVRGERPADEQPGGDPTMPEPMVLEQAEGRPMVLKQSEEELPGLDRAEAGPGLEERTAGLPSRRDTGGDDA